jgi:hypothetical protein
MHKNALDELSVVTEAQAQPFSNSNEKIETYHLHDWRMAGRKISLGKLA